MIHRLELDNVLEEDLEVTLDHFGTLGLGGRAEKGERVVRVHNILLSRWTQWSG